MLRRAISTLALTAVLTAPAAAQVVSSPFWFNGSNAPAGIEAPYGEWHGSFNNSSWFQVWCVDYANLVGHPTDNYNVWVTPFGDADESKIRKPGLSYANYIEAAQFALLMEGAHGRSVSEQTDIQVAIWYLMGYGNTAERAVWDDYYAAWAPIAHLNPVSEDDWVIITGTGKQEFIAFRANPPQETVPEPATMTLLATGLAGMAAARRRNKKS